MTTVDKARDWVLDALVHRAFDRAEVAKEVDALIAAVRAECRPYVPEHSRLVLVSEDLFDLIGTRTEDGARLSYTWGEPDASGWYTPTVHRHDDDRLCAESAETLRALTAERDALAEDEQACAETLRVLREAAAALVDDGYDHPDGCECDNHEWLRALLAATPASPYDEVGDPHEH